MKIINAILSILLTILSLAIVVTGCGTSSDGGGSNGDTSPNIIFVTSETGTGDLSTWPSAGGKTGLEAADNICQTLADNAGLSGTFVAWLSDSNNDAYCRIHGLTGKKGNCSPQNPTSQAGPWVRTDGFPFGGKIDSILGLNGKVYAPAKFDESGNPIPAATPTDLPIQFTGTFEDGTLNTDWSTCSDWTSNAAIYAGAGDSYRTTESWTHLGASFCDWDRHLLCMQTGSGGPLPSFTSSGKKVFYATGSYPAGQTQPTGFNSIAVADTICQDLATAASLTGTFKAWLSDSGVDAIDRLTSNGPWVRLDGVKVADDKNDLIDGEIFTSISVTEQGIYVGNYGAWTGTTSSGTLASDNCNNWADYEPTMGVAALANSTDVRWTDKVYAGYGTTLCSSGFSLYCFED
jgi:hypothetical protein